MTVHHRLWLWPHLTLTGRSKPSGGLEVFFMSEPCIDAGRLFAVMPYHTICTHRIIPPWFPAVFSGMFWVLPNWFFCNLWLCTAMMFSPFSHAHTYKGSTIQLLSDSSHWPFYVWVRGGLALSVISGLGTLAGLRSGGASVSYSISSLRMDCKDHAISICLYTTWFMDSLTLEVRPCPQFYIQELDTWKMNCFLHCIVLL